MEGQVVNNYLLTALWVFMSFLIAWVLALGTTNKFPKFAERTHVVAFVLGTGFLLIAGIGRLGWSLQTIDGTTHAEELDQQIFLWLSFSGTVLLVYEFWVQKFLRKQA